MRFPKRPFTKRTFDLVEKKLELELIPCTVRTVHHQNTRLFYNNTCPHDQDDPADDDPFNVKASLTDPSLATPRGISDKITALVQPYRDLFRPLPNGTGRDIAAPMAKLFEDTDQLSIKEFMAKRGMSDIDISWCETLARSTGRYDRALSQSK